MDRLVTSFYNLPLTNYHLNRYEINCENCYGSRPVELLKEKQCVYIKSKKNKSLGVCLVHIFAKLFSCL